MFATDADARAYISAVNAADGQALEQNVQLAIDAFVIGCKADGIWSAIKASCILMGARTLSGALTPLVGAAPTNNNFVSADYNRKTGLVGNGTSKYLDSNRNNNADPQNSKHAAVFPTSAVGGGNFFNSGGGGVSGRTGIGFALTAPNENTAQTSNNSSLPFGAEANVSSALASGFLMGLSRSGASTYTARFNGANTTINANSGTPNDGNITIYARQASLVDQFNSSRIAFYSIGESLALSSLDSRVTTLYNAIGAAIP